MSTGGYNQIHSQFCPPPPHGPGGALFLSWLALVLMKVAAAVERKSVKQLLIDLSRIHLEELEKKAFLPKGK